MHDPENPAVMNDSPSSNPRLYYLDWLRVLAMLGVFLYHNNRFYDFYGWHVKNALLSTGSTTFENVLGMLLMPLLFVLSGAAVFYSLKARTVVAFFKERVLRLLVPLVILGRFVFGPVQIYLERLSHGEFSGSFWQFLPHYFDGLYGFGGNFAWMGVHLWYLMLLFIFSVIFLPLFLPSKKTGKSLITRLSQYFTMPWALFLLFVPLAIATNLTDILGLQSTRNMGGWDIFSYMLFFLYGYLLFSNTEIRKTINKYCFIFLYVVIALSIFWLIMKTIVLPEPDSGFFLSAELRSLTSWLTILAILGIAVRYLNMNKRFLSYANEAVLPFYILHQPVILTIGFFVVQWDLPIIAKYFIIATTSFVVIMAIYELLVRRINVLRFVFGMKLKRVQH